MPGLTRTNGRSLQWGTRSDFQHEPQDVPNFAFWVLL